MLHLKVERYNNHRLYYVCLKPFLLWFLFRYFQKYCIKGSYFFHPLLMNMILVFFLQLHCLAHILHNKSIIISAARKRLVNNDALIYFNSKPDRVGQQSQPSEYENQMGNVQLWNRALSGKEVAALYACGGDPAGTQ